MSDASLTKQQEEDLFGDPDVWMSPGYRLHPVKKIIYDDNDHAFEQCLDSDPDRCFYGLYRVLADGELAWIADVGDFEDGLRIMRALAEYKP